MSELSAREVYGWISAVEAESKEVETALVPLLERQRAIEERLGILRRLLISLGGDGALAHGTGASSLSVSESGNGVSYVVGQDNGGLSVRERVIRDATEILKGAEGPMHINDIHAEFVKRGYEIPGAGKPVNITVHLSSAESVVSPSRGMYALRLARASREPVRDESRSHARG